MYAAGDVAGGCPQKYVTGALAEGEIAALHIIKNLSERPSAHKSVPEHISRQAAGIIAGYETVRNEENPVFSVEEMEEAMQKIMDEYAGGITRNYQYSEAQLKLAAEKIERLEAMTAHIGAANMHELLFACELRERLTVCKTLLVHLRNRRETRWHSFNEYLDYPDRDEAYFKYLNTRLKDGQIQVIFRDIVEAEVYEHTD